MYYKIFLKAIDESYFVAKTLISYFDEDFQAYEVRIRFNYTLLLKKVNGCDIT